MCPALVYNNPTKEQPSITRPREGWDAPSSGLEQLSIIHPKEGPKCTQALGETPTLLRGQATGSEKPTKGRARLRKPFLYEARSRCPCTTLYSSRHASPTTAAVVVAIAGMIFPAISLLWGRGSEKGRGSVLGNRPLPPTLILPPLHWLQTHLVPVGRGDVVVLGPQVGGSHDEIHVEVGVIVLREGRRSERGSQNAVSSGAEQQRTVKCNVELGGPRCGSALG